MTRLTRRSKVEMHERHPSGVEPYEKTIARALAEREKVRIIRHKRHG